MGKQLVKAREYEQYKKQEIEQIEKPSYHVSAPIGWLNDPNGFSTYQGIYHLFFQYHPYQTVWGPMHWGHCTTKDFIRWEYQPIALAPEEEFDESGCFSGSAIEHEGEHVLVYTGVYRKKDKEGKTITKQVQCIASGDGKNYKKWDCNPIIESNTIPKNRYEEDFRDPKIWKNGNSYYLIAASRSEDGSGQIAIYKSLDMKKWEFVSIMDRSNNEYGAMWECPDFFAMEKQHVFILSPQDMSAKGLEFHNGNNAVYMVGSFSYDDCKFHRQRIASLDYGLDFYAPQTLLAEDGRRIMIAWMQSWDTNILPKEFKWNGMMTVPRELILKEGKIIQKPVRELEAYYRDEILLEDTVLAGEQSFRGIQGREINLEIEILEGEYSKLEIRFACSKDYYTSCTYFPMEGIVTFDRTYSGMCRDAVAIRSMQVKRDSQTIKLQLLLDKYSAELFVNDGEQVMSNVFYTSLQAEDILFITKGSAIAHIKKQRIEVIHAL